MTDLDRALEWWENNQDIELDRRELRRLCGVFADPARRFASLTSPETIEKHRDTIDLFVAETLYEEAIAHNVDARGGTAVESDWPSWDDLGEFGRDHWLSMAVAARLSFLAVLRSVEEGKT